MIKSVRLILLATAALVIALTIQQQSVAAFNDTHNPGVTLQHSNNAATTLTSAQVLNWQQGHYNQNCNSQRAGDSCITNTNSH
jgi:hypothetical protein